MGVIELIGHLNKIYKAIFTWNHFLIIYIFLFIADTILLIHRSKDRKNCRTY